MMTDEQNLGVMVEDLFNKAHAYCTLKGYDEDKLLEKFIDGLAAGGKEVISPRRILSPPVKNEEVASDNKYWTMVVDPNRIRTKVPTKEFHPSLTDTLLL